MATPSKVTSQGTALIVAAFWAIGAAMDFKHLHVTYRIPSYFELPVTTSQMTSEFPDYVYVTHDHVLNVDLYSWPNDPRVCLLFDTFGNIAGIRFSLIKADVENQATFNGLTFPINYDEKPMYTSGRYWGLDLWYTSVLFADPDKIKAGGRQDTGGLVAEEIYVKIGGSWTQMPRNECLAESQDFNKQACYTGMGMHYFHKSTKTSDCLQLEQVFLLYELEDLIGLGLSPFGSFTSEERVWFENGTESIVRAIQPNGPECLFDWTTKYGLTSFHIFFKKWHELTFCTWPWQKDDSCKSLTQTP